MRVTVYKPGKGPIRCRIDRRTFDGRRVVRRDCLDKVEVHDLVQREAEREKAVKEAMREAESSLNAQ
jgi:hypothetical protein